VIHLNGYVHGALPWQAPALIVAHSCVCSWWQAVKGHPAPPEWDRYRSLVRQGLRAVAAVVAPSAAMLENIQQLYGPLPPSCVIYNGRDPSLFSIANKEPFIFSAGRLWDEAKNVAVLDQIAPRLGWPLYLAGDELGPGHESYAKRLDRLAPPAMASWLGRASIYALPARYEPFGLSILEAALCGCALVLGDIPSLREIWGDAAQYVMRDDPAALQRTLNSLAGDTQARGDWAARARARARRFTAAPMGQAYLELYRDLSRRAMPLNLLSAGSRSIPGYAAAGATLPHA
jgi:glycosyltransferase involved in cell wall biosynthesis